MAFNNSSRALASVAPPLSNLGAAGCVCAIGTDRELPVLRPQTGPFPESTHPEYGSIQRRTKKRMSLTACGNSIWFEFCDCLKMAIFGSRMAISRPFSDGIMGRNDDIYLGTSYLGNHRPQPAQIMHAASLRYYVDRFFFDF